MVRKRPSIPAPTSGASPPPPKSSPQAARSASGSFASSFSSRTPASALSARQFRRVRVRWLPSPWLRQVGQVSLQPVQRLPPQGRPRLVGQCAGVDSVVAQCIVPVVPRRPAPLCPGIPTEVRRPTEGLLFFRAPRNQTLWRVAAGCCHDRHVPAGELCRGEGRVTWPTGGAVAPGRFDASVDVTAAPNTITRTYAGVSHRRAQNGSRRSGLVCRFRSNPFAHDSC